MTMSTSWDAELLRRYDQPGPRYTSYPTAPQFHTGFGEADYRLEAQRSNEDPIPRRLSLYAHVPFCSSPCFYCGCNRIITRDKTRGAVYLLRLQREIARAAPLFDRDREVVQIHLGGGTPNFLSPDQLGELMASFRQQFNLSGSRGRDFSIELDPRFINRSEVAQLGELGFNRASLGVQDFNPDVQKAVNRLQSVESTLEVVEGCRDAGFRSINIDLIYGLPKQTLEGFAQTLDTVLEVRPDRLAIYGYAHMPTLFRPQQRINEDELPSPGLRLALLQLAIAKLSAAGYQHIGMDHFALPEDELARAQTSNSLQRNFMGYTTHAQTDLIGFGVSAISRIGDGYAQSPRVLADWQTCVDSDHLAIWRGMRLSKDDRIREDVIQQLMCNGSVDVPRIEQRHDIAFDSYFSSELTRLQTLVDDDLVAVSTTRIEATARGRLLLRTIAMCFDAYLHGQSTTPARFSKAI